MGVPTPRRPSKFHNGRANTRRPSKFHNGSVNTKKALVKSVKPKQVLSFTFKRQRGSGGRTHPLRILPILGTCLTFYSYACSEHLLS